MYFIAIMLPDRLNEKIVDFKKWMKENYGSRVGLKSPAHLTLVAPFWMEEEKESCLSADLETLAKDVVPFTLTTADFSAFVPRTIFVALAPSEAIEELKRNTDRFLRNKNYKLKTETRPFHPHITIATRDLHKKDFAGAWPYFEEKQFRECFAATALSLLKHNGRTWEVIFSAPFVAV